MPLHITTRGVDHGPTFLTTHDFAHYRWVLRKALEDAECALHAYVLMTNHVHLLVTPAGANGPARLMTSLGRSYVRYFNDRNRRTGPLWDGRYRASPVDSDPYFFECSRYVERNPVRAGLVMRPGDYEWSSVHYNTRGEADPLVTPHELFVALGPTPEARRAAYRTLLEAEPSIPMVATLRAGQRRRPHLQSTPYRQAVARLEARHAAEAGADRTELSRDRDGTTD